MLRALYIALMIAILTPGMALAKSDADKDRRFLTDAIKGDNSEIVLGRLAMQRGNSNGVRDFGHALVRDHKKAKIAADPVAKELGLQPSREITPEAEKERKKLLGLSGADFDKEFVDYMVKDHKDDIKEFREQAEKGDDTTSNLARNTIPGLKKHLQIAERLKKAF